MSTVKPNSRITLHNTANDTVANISIEQVIPGKDAIIKIKPTSNSYITEKRLKTIKQNIQNYLSDPSLDKTITPPVITSVSQKDSEITFKLRPYTSNIMLPYCGVEYRIATTRDFQPDTIIVSEMLHNVDVTNGLVISTDLFTSRQTYYIQVSYIGGGYISNPSTVFEFSPSFPTIETPSITGVVFNYNQTAPYATTINITSSPFISTDGSVHLSSSWRIYKKISDDQYDVIYNIDEDTNNLTSLTIRDLIPAKISHGDEFLVSVTHYGSGQAYSRESEKVAYRSLGVNVTPSKHINIYPIEHNVSNPVFIVDNDYSININGLILQQTFNDFESFEWELEEQDISRTIKTYTTTSNKLELSEGELLPGRTYRIRNRYKHRNLGYSAYVEKEFKTKDAFVTSLDKLAVPSKTLNNSAYFGEIAYDQLMFSSVKYCGTYDPNSVYSIGDEVLKEGVYYICVEGTSNASNFERCFKLPSHTSAKAIYKSGLPTMAWLLENIGLNPYLNSDSNYSSNGLINEGTGWVKVQNDRGQILYIAKKPVMDNISINDLIDRDLYHPRRKTIRIGENLYYIRILVSQLEVGYDALDPLYRGENFNEAYRHHDPINYDEDELLINLMNSKLSTYDPVDLDIPLTYKELIYNIDNIYGYKLDQSGGQVSLLNQILPYADDRTLRYRPVLELIPPENHPYKNISTLLPKSTDIVEDGEFNPEEYYDKYLDAGYLGYVSVDDFITSESIDVQTGLNSNKHLPILGWYKFYYRGLVYFIPNGVNLKNVTYTEVSRANMITPTPRFNYNVTSDKIRFGKVFHNGIIYNVGCPNGLKYTNIRETVMTTSGAINIFENMSPVYDPDFCYNTFLSDVIYPVLSNIGVDRNRKGYKGRYKRLKSIEIMEQFGNGNEETSSFLLGDIIRYQDGGVFTEKPIINFQKYIAHIGKKNITDGLDVISCLNVNPIFDKPELW